MLALPDALPPYHQQQQSKCENGDVCMFIFARADLHAVVEFRKVCSEFFDTYVCASVQACMCMCVCAALPVVLVMIREGAGGWS